MVSFSDFKRTENDRVGLPTDLNIPLVAIFDPYACKNDLVQRQRITSSDTSIVPAGSRNSAESVQMLRLIEVFAAVFIVEPGGVFHTKIRTMIVFYTIFFQISFLFVRMIVIA